MGLLHYYHHATVYDMISVMMMSNKKLRYREEHSASVVLSWCIL